MASRINCRNGEDPANVAGARARQALCLLVTVVSLATLLGWVLHVELLETVLPNHTTMKVNTAIGLLFGSVGFWPAPRRGWRAVAGLVLAAISLATLIEYALGVRLGIDVLIADPATTSFPFNGRMSPATALALACLGAAATLLALGRGRAGCGRPLPRSAAGRNRRLDPHQLCYGVERQYYFGPFVSLALGSALCLCALAGAALATRPDEGWRQRFVGYPAALAALARLRPWSLALPFLTGLLVLAGVHLGLYGASFGPALFSVITIAARTAELVQSQTLEALGQLTGGVAHDFNNLLTPIIGSLELLQRRLPSGDAAAQHMAGNALQSAARAAALVQRLLAFARRQELQPRPSRCPSCWAGSRT